MARYPDAAAEIGYNGAMNRTTAADPKAFMAALQAGVAHHRAGRLDEAEAAYRGVVTAQPKHADALHLLGVIAHQRGDNQAAVEHIRRAIAANRRVVDYHGNLGLALLELDRAGEAAAAFRSALKLAPDNGEMHNNLGNALRRQGKPKHAVQAYRRAVKARPDYAAGHYNLANALRDQGRLDDALAAYGRALEIEPGFAEAHNNLGIALRDQGRLDAAAAAYQRAIEIKPDFAEAHNNLGAAVIDLGRKADAVAAYRRALENRPGFADAGFNLQAALYDDADPGPAAEALEGALGADPDHHGARFQLGVIRALQGDGEAAAACFARFDGAAQGHGRYLDSWDYAKAHRGPATRFFGCLADTLAFCIGQAEGDGLVLEFGVRFGTSIRLIAGATDRAVHGFDSFEGLPEAWGDMPRGAYSTKGVLPEVPANVTLHAGLFADTIPPFKAGHDGPIRFLNIDCDLYSATKTIFDELGERVAPGTVILFDEYLINQSWRDDEFKAFQEAVAHYGWDYEYIAFNLVTKQAAVRVL